MKDLQVIKGVSCYEESGIVYIKLEDAARGLGFTYVKNNIEYVRWERLDKYLKEFGFATSGEDKEFGIPNKLWKESFIPENIFYRLAMKANNETAERFQALVADEIIPSIRKHGGYIAGQETMTDEELLSRALLLAQSKIEEKNRIIMQHENKILEDKPKVDFFNAVADSKTAISMGDVAKVLGIKGMGRNKLYEFLRNKKILMYDNTPYQVYINRGYFRVVESEVKKKNGEIEVRTKTLVYQKGVDFIRRLLV